jgi:hypothetical protein
MIFCSSAQRGWTHPAPQWGTAYCKFSGLLLLFYVFDTPF